MLIKHDLGNQQFYNKTVKKIKVKINFILRLLMWRYFGRFLYLKQECYIFLNIRMCAVIFLLLFTNRVISLVLLEINTTR
jgi:hypothetical protein